jgi:hypothetical protein
MITFSSIAGDDANSRNIQGLSRFDVPSSMAHCSDLGPDVGLPTILGHEERFRNPERWPSTPG